MSAVLLVNVTQSETRIALVEHGMLQEVHIERQNKLGIVGNIYKGRISRVLPGMQAAFVDIGLDKAAFLHASDIVPHTECVTPQEKQHFQAADISSLVSQGQYIMVQIVKDPIGTKGARLTTDITLPSRYLVFMPGSSHVGVSQRIESQEERERLKAVAEKHVDETGGFIVRTAAEGAGRASSVRTRGSSSTSGRRSRKSAGRPRSASASMRICRLPSVCYGTLLTRRSTGLWWIRNSPMRR